MRVTEHRLHRLRSRTAGPPRGLSCRPRRQPARSVRVSRRRSPRLWSATAFRAATRSSCWMSCSARGSQADRSTPSWRRVATALAGSMRSCSTTSACAPAVNIDETGWRPRGKRRTLWCAITPLAASFRIAPDRHEREALALLDEHFEGVVGSDRRWPYRGFDPARPPVYWSHRIRDFTAHAEGLAAQGEFGERGLDIARQLLCAWDEFQIGRDRRRLSARWRRSSASKGSASATFQGQAPQARPRLLEDLLKVWPALWTCRDRRRRADQQPGRACAAPGRVP